MEEKICHREKFWIVKVTYAQSTLAYLVGLLHTCIKKGNIFLKKQ